MQFGLGHNTRKTFATGRSQRCPSLPFKRASSCSSSSQPVSHVNACTQRLYQQRCSHGGCSHQSVAVRACRLGPKRSTRIRAGPSDGPSTSNSDAETESAPLEIAAAGEDAANFQLQQQSASSWGIFTVLLVGALAALYAVGRAIRVICQAALCNSLITPAYHAHQ